ncbi:MAG: NAD(P)-dependent oxidoreductase [Chloroflexota bacterium]
MTTRIGIVGTGFIARGLALALGRKEIWRVSKVLTRRKIVHCKDFPRPDLLTNSIQELIDHVDVVVECSGDVINATDVIAQVIAVGFPIVTMNSEFHVTTGSYFVGKGMLSEAEGDQPGCLAELRENILAMGFSPLVYGNVKGFYNPNPSQEDMVFWSKKQGISLRTVTAATDGTKIQFEQALVANGLGADILKQGMLAPRVDDLHQGAIELAEKSTVKGKAICDYVLLPGSETRVFIVATHQEIDRKNLEYLKMGPGPYYLHKQDSILTYLEIPKTIQRILDGKPPLLNNSTNPRIGVAAVAKKMLKRDEYIEEAIGGFEVRGIAINILEFPDHVPIGLLRNARLKRNVRAGKMLRLDDVELNPSFAVDVWFILRERIING